MKIISSLKSPNEKFHLELRLRKLYNICKFQIEDKKEAEAIPFSWDVVSNRKLKRYQNNQDRIKERDWPNKHFRLLNREQSLVNHLRFSLSALHELHVVLKNLNKILLSF